MSQSEVAMPLLKLGLANEKILVDLLLLPTDFFGEYSGLLYFAQNYYQRFNQLLTPTLMEQLVRQGGSDALLQLQHQYNEVQNVPASEEDFQALFTLARAEHSRSSLAHSIEYAIGALERKESPFMISERLMAQLQSTMEIAQPTTRRHKLKEEALQVVDHYLKEGQETLNLVPFGFPTLDRELGGMKKGDLALVLGPTGGGKTTFLVNLACNLFLQNHKILFVTLEVPLRRMRSRFHARLLGMDYMRLLQYMVDPDTYRQNLQQLLQYSGEVSIVDMPPGTTVSQIGGTIAREKPDIVFIDYIGLMNATKNYNDDWQEQQSVANDLKALARRHEIIVVTAAQLNREGNLREDLRMGDTSRCFGLTNPSSFVFGIRIQGELMILRVLKANDAPVLTITLRANFSHMLLQENQAFQAQDLSNWSRPQQARGD
jgi:replicative DNA helicase